MLILESNESTKLQIIFLSWLIFCNYEICYILKSTLVVFSQSWVLNISTCRQNSSTTRKIFLHSCDVYRLFYTFKVFWTVKLNLFIGDRAINLEYLGEKEIDFKLFMLIYMLKLRSFIFILKPCIYGVSVNKRGLHNIVLCVHILY